MNRRGFLIGAGASLFAAPAIVRAASLMSVRALPSDLYAVTVPDKMFWLGPDGWRIVDLAAPTVSYGAVQLRLAPYDPSQWYGTAGQ